MSDEIEKITQIKTAAKPNIRQPLIFGLAVIILFFGGFFLWALFSPLESAAIAPGKIVVAGYRRTIQSKDGGIINTIQVKNGSVVKKGETLLTLDDSEATLAYQLHHNHVMELTAIEARLIAENMEKKQIDFPITLLNEKDKPKISQIIQNQKRIFKNNQQSYQENIEILKQRIEQLHQQISGQQAHITALKRQIELVDKEESQVAELAAKKLIEQPRLMALQRQAAQLRGQKGSSLSQIAALQEKIGETKIQLTNLKTQRQKEHLEELRQIQQKLVEAKQREKATMIMLKRTKIRSPINGTVVGLNFHTIGGVIQPGETIMDIVPTHEALVVEAFVQPIDIDVVHPGLEAQVQLTAFKTRTTPTLTGKVVTVSADALINEKTNKEYYLARIIIARNELAKLTKKQKLYPGMPVQVMIVTAKLTPWQYFISPIRSSFNRAFREQ